MITMLISTFVVSTHINLTPRVQLCDELAIRVQCLSREARSTRERVHAAGVL